MVCYNPFDTYFVERIILMENRSKGILYILLSSLFFAFMAAFVKSVAHIPLAEKIFFRNFVGIIAMFWLIKKDNISLIPNNKKLIIMRSLSGLAGVTCYFYSITYLPLADAAILNRTSPLFVVILSVLFLHEKVTKKQFYALLTALIGAIFVVKPEMNLSVLPSLVGLLAAFFAGTAYTIIRKLRLYDDSRIIVFYFCLISVLLTSPFMFLGGLVVPTAKDLFYLIMIGVMATTAQFLMTNGYRHAPASELAVYSYSSILFSILIGLVVWTEIPDFYSLIGATLIVSSGLINYFTHNNKTVKSKIKIQ